MRGLNAHEEYASANTLRNSIRMPINMDSTKERFVLDKRGGYFSNTTWNESTFYKKNFHVPPEVDKDQPPIGRPLFLKEIAKPVPPPNKYDVKRNPEIAEIQPLKRCQFGSTFNSYRRTCDI